jgi:hypothetical protein
VLGINGVEERPLERTIAYALDEEAAVLDALDGEYGWWSLHRTNNIGSVRSVVELG